MVTDAPNTAFAHWVWTQPEWMKAKAMHGNQPRAKLYRLGQSDQPSSSIWIKSKYWLVREEAELRSENSAMHFWNSIYTTQALTSADAGMLCTPLWSKAVTGPPNVWAPMPCSLGLPLPGHGCLDEVPGSLKQFKGSAQQHQGQITASSCLERPTGP